LDLVGLHPLRFIQESATEPPTTFLAQLVVLISEFLSALKHVRVNLFTPNEISRGD